MRDVLTEAQRLGYAPPPRSVPVHGGLVAAFAVVFAAALTVLLLWLMPSAAECDPPPAHLAHQTDWDDRKCW